MMDAETLAAITCEVEAAGLSEQQLATLRARYPGIHFTYCMDDDVGVQEPCSAGRGFNVYLVDGSGHCLQFTQNLQQATGLVLAEVIADD